MRATRETRLDGGKPGKLPVPENNVPIFISDATSIIIAQDYFLRNILVRRPSGDIEFVPGGTPWRFSLPYNFKYVFFKYLVTLSSWVCGSCLSQRGA